MSERRTAIVPTPRQRFARLFCFAAGHRWRAHTRRGLRLRTCRRCGDEQRISATRCRTAAQNGRTTPAGTS